MISRIINQLIWGNGLPSSWPPKCDPRILWRTEPVSTIVLWISHVKCDSNPPPVYVCNPQENQVDSMTHVTLHTLNFSHTQPQVACSHFVFSFSNSVFLKGFFFPLHSCITTQCLNVMDKLPCCYFPFHLKMQMAEWKLYQACQRQENNWLISLWPSEDWFRGNAIISH